MRAGSIDIARKMKKLEKTCKKFFTIHQDFVSSLCRREALPNQDNETYHHRPTGKP